MRFGDMAEGLLRVGQEARRGGQSLGPWHEEHDLGGLPGPAQWAACTVCGAPVYVHARHAYGRALTLSCAQVQHERDHPEELERRLRAYFAAGDY